MTFQPTALVACCECANRQTLVKLVSQCGLKPIIATRTNDAVAILGSESLCVAFCQDDLPGDGFKAVLKAAQEVAVPVVISSHLNDSERYLESMRLGAYDFICLPYYYPEVAALTTAAPHRLSPQTTKSRPVNVRVAS